MADLPRAVDPDLRRRDLAEATWRVVRRDGLDAASVRNVAAEAGLSMGSLRHYFGSQSELLAFSMRLVADRITARVEALLALGDTAERSEEILAELLPLDAERRAENEVWLAFSARTLVDPGLQALAEELYDDLRALMGRVVAERAAAGLVAGGADLTLEADRLHALVDGLVAHALARPAHATPARLRAIIRAHLTALA